MMFCTVISLSVHAILHAMAGSTHAACSVRQSCVHCGEKKVSVLRLFTRLALSLALQTQRCWLFFAVCMLLLCVCVCAHVICIDVRMLLGKKVDVKIGEEKKVTGHVCGKKSCLVLMIHMDVCMCMVCVCVCMYVCMHI
jgi:hypothetical protein